MYGYGWGTGACEYHDTDLPQALLEPYDTKGTRIHVFLYYLINFVWDQKICLKF